jgi:aminoglycoside phosphotransferase (APT) family kinase protein
MHADEVHTDAALVRRLLAAQFPQWAELCVEPVPSAGTDNALYRLGPDMAVRLPRIAWAAWQVDKEQQYLPRLAQHLPLPIPVPLARGAPGEGYPWDWSVYQWLEGENATLDRVASPRDAAMVLAQFIAALHRIDPAGGPPPGPHNSFRGVPLPARDAATRTAISALHGTLDVVAVTATWEAALQTPAWCGPPVWVHGDLQSGNLLTQHGRLSAVIDFGCLGVGDPACDLIVAWNLFSTATRTVLRDALAVDAATWARGRGWALSVALIQLPYYQRSNPVLAAMARYTIAEVLADIGAADSSRNDAFATTS